MSWWMFMRIKPALVSKFAAYSCWVRHILFHNTTCSKGTKISSLCLFQMLSIMKITRSLAVLILISTQMIALMSLFLWILLLRFLSLAGGSYSISNNVFLSYPVIPLAFGVAAWVFFKKKRYNHAVLITSIPAVVAFALMTYYYIVGVSN